jgi:hypothetical protein
MVRGARVVRSAQRGDGAWEDAGTSVLLTTGIGFEIAGDDTAARLALALDGTRTVGQAIGAVAPDSRTAAMRMVRRLLELGFAAPVRR